MTDLCARWRGPERRAGQAPALSSMITTSPCGREQRVGQCQAPHERSGAAGCETARGVDTRTPHALCSGRQCSASCPPGHSLAGCCLCKVVDTRQGAGLRVPGAAHIARPRQARLGASPRPARRPAAGGTARARVHWGAPSGRGMRAPGAQTRGARARGGAGGGPGPGAGNGAAPAARRARGARCRCERAGRARGPERGVQRPAGTGMARRSKSRGAVSRAPRRGLGVGRGGRAGPGRARRGVAPASPQRRRFLRRPVSVSPPAPPAGSAHPGGAPGRHPAAPPPAPEPRSAGAGLAPGKGLSPARGERDGQTRAGGSRPNPSLSLTAEPGDHVFTSQ